MMTSEVIERFEDAQCFGKATFLQESQCRWFSKRNHHCDRDVSAIGQRPLLRVLSAPSLLLDWGRSDGQAETHFAGSSHLRRLLHLMAVISNGRQRGEIDGESFVKLRE
jgi:hypothetical protein